MALKMALQITIWAPYESCHKTFAVAVSLNISRQLSRLLITHLNLFEK